MEFELLGGESAGPTLRLDHERFAYAGKFVMSRTGKAVVRQGDDLVGAIAFSTDTDDERLVHLRYVTVREDRRGEGIGPKLLRFTAERLRDRYDRIEIAVNNPIAYEACYRAGFAYTGRETGIAELVMSYRPTSRGGTRYRDGFVVFGTRDLPPEQERVRSRHEDGEPPAVVDVPAGIGDS